MLLLLALSLASSLCAAPEGALDPAVATRHEGSDLLWYDATLLGIEGQGFTELAHPYDRLPASAEGVVRADVWELSHESAGLCVRFETDATTIGAHWVLRSGSLAMPHMPATGVSGLDLYGRTPEGWHWVGAGRPGSVDNTGTLASGLDPGPREFLLYLPLYNGVDTVEIGLPEGTYVKHVAPPDSAAPIVFYGTSVTQGGCASRPGMAYPPILGRWLDRATVNLGFSGNGWMEPELADLISQIDASAYVLDCLANMSPDSVREHVPPFVRTLRGAHPDTPIVLLEIEEFQQAALSAGTRETFRSFNEALRAAYEELLGEGVVGLTYIEGGDLLGHDGEATVDGVHATDLGFMRIAEAMRDPLAAAIGVEIGE